MKVELRELKDEIKYAENKINDRIDEFNSPVTLGQIRTAVNRFLQLGYSYDNLIINLTENESNIIQNIYSYQSRIPKIKLDEIDGVKVKINNNISNMFVSCDVDE